MTIHRFIATAFFLSALAMSSDARESPAVFYPVPLFNAPFGGSKPWPSRFLELSDLEERVRFTRDQECLIIGESKRDKKIFLCFATKVNILEEDKFNDTRMIGKHEGQVFVIGRYEIERELGRQIIRLTRKCLKGTCYPGQDLVLEQYTESIVCESLLGAIPLAGLVVVGGGEHLATEAKLEDPVLALKELYGALCPSGLAFIAGAEIAAPLKQELDKLRGLDILPRLEKGIQ